MHPPTTDRTEVHVSKLDTRVPNKSLITNKFLGSARRGALVLCQRGVGVLFTDIVIPVQPLVWMWLSQYQGAVGCIVYSPGPAGTHTGIKHTYTDVTASTLGAVVPPSPERSS